MKLLRVDPALTPGYAWYVYDDGTQVMQKTEVAAKDDDECPQVIVRDPNKHDEDRHRLVYGRKEMRCNEDLHHPVAAKEWPGYIQEADRHGPPPFRSTVERREYKKRYGFEDS